MFQLGKAQKQGIGESLTGAGLAIRDFNWQWHDGMAYGFTDSQVPTLVYRDTRFVFALAEASQGYRVYWTPDDQQHAVLARCYRWSEVLTASTRWGLALREEIRAIDPWAAIIAAAPKQIVSAEGPNTPFEAVERERIDAALERLREEILRLRVATEDQQKFIAATFADQHEAIKRLGRVDWKNQFVGWVVNLVTTLMLSPEAQQVVGAAATVVMHAAQHGVPLLSR